MRTLSTRFFLTSPCFLPLSYFSANILLFDLPAAIKKRPKSRIIRATMDSLGTKLRRKIFSLSAQRVINFNVKFLLKRVVVTSNVPYENWMVRATQPLLRNYRCHKNCHDTKRNEITTKQKANAPFTAHPNNKERITISNPIKTTPLCWTREAREFQFEFL